MSGLSRAGALLTLAWLTAGVIGCTETQARRQHPMTPVPISNIKQVTGKWEGLSKRVPDMRDDAEVLLIIEDNETFQFVGSRLTDMIVGAGTFTLQNGKLMGTTARLSATVTLHDREGESILVVDATRKDGNRYHIELTPAK